MESSFPHTTRELLDWIENNPRLRSIYTLLESNRASEEDSAHDMAHLLRVGMWTLRLGGKEISQEEGVAAALLHDLINLPKNHPDRAKASEYSAEKARSILQEQGFESVAIERITTAIREHSFSRGLTPSIPLSRALQDADRLEALGAIGLMRVFSTGAKMGSKYFHHEDPFAKHRPLDDKAFSVDHFYTKLLRLPTTFQTEKGREEALRRLHLLDTFLAALGRELGDPAP